MLTLAAFALPALMAANAASPPTTPTPPMTTPDQVLRFLGETIDWYRQTEALGQTPLTAQEVIFRNAVHQSAVQAVQLAFTSARAQAAVLKSQATSAPAKAGGGRSRDWGKAAVAAAERVAQIRADIERLDLDITATSAPSAESLLAQRRKLQSLLNLANARQEVLREVVGFASAAGSAGGLAQQINDMEKTVPDAAKPIVIAESADNSAADAPPAPPVAAAAPAPAPAQPPLRTEAMGILDRVGELLALSRQMGRIAEAVQLTDSLDKTNEELRVPLRAELMKAVARGDTLAQTRESDDSKSLDTQRQELDTLADRFKQFAAAAAPLGEQGLFLESSRDNLVQWQATLEREFVDCRRRLILRLGVTSSAILILLAVASVWRRVTFRYVADVRRRRQFLMVRRAIVGFIVILILTGALVTEFTSLMTFAGLLTAGVAVALQTIILSGVAHFFFLGRYGVRVGDRVTISGTTGDVIDVGIFRLYLMEMGGKHSDQPTGRIVVFANSVLFQSTAFFKQFPGADFAWHEVALTLSPDSDYHVAERRLLGAVQSVYTEYRHVIERQYAMVKSAYHSQSVAPGPEGRLRFIEAGIEYVIRYPVEIRRAAETDDRVTRRLLDAIEQAPGLRLVASGTPRIQPMPVAAPADAPSNGTTSRKTSGILIPAA